MLSIRHATFVGLEFGEDQLGNANEHQVGKAGRGTPRVECVITQRPTRGRSEVDHGPLEVTLGLMKDAVVRAGHCEPSSLF